MSKDDILAGYLNIIYFGNGAYGIEAASKLYFNTTAKDLTLPQAAVLAGVVNRPSFYDPVTQPENAVNRRNDVLAKLLDQKKISQKDYAAAVATPLNCRSPSRPKAALPHQRRRILRLCPAADSQ